MTEKTEQVDEFVTPRVRPGADEVSQEPAYALPPTQTEVHQYPEATDEVPIS